MESNHTNPATNIMDPSRILDHLEEISRKVQEVQTPITELEEKFEDLPRKIQEAEIAITDVKEKLKAMRILEETSSTSGHTTIDGDFKDETE